MPRRRLQPSGVRGGSQKPPQRDWGEMIRIMCVTPSAGGGWAPVTAMATLMGECFDAPVSFVHPARDYSRARRALSLVPRRRGSKGHLLLIAARPGDLLALVGGPAHLAGFDSVSAWIFDAFWDEEIPRMARRAGFVDQFFIPDAELVGVYASATRTPVAWLPWGTDTLAGQAGRFSGARAYDVLRLGRQPAVLDDDTVTSLALQKHRRTFWRCPPFSGDGVGEPAHRAQRPRGESRRPRLGQREQSGGLHPSDT